MDNVCSNALKGRMKMYPLSRSASRFVVDI